MRGTLIINREGNKLDNKLFDVPYEVFLQAQIQIQAVGCVNISWTTTTGVERFFSCSHATGAAWQDDI